jgi:hypothetical protein
MSVRCELRVDPLTGWLHYVYIYRDVRIESESLEQMRSAVVDKWEIWK